MSYDIIDNFSKLFINEAYDKYKHNDYLYLTKEFRSEIYQFSLEVGFSCKYIILQILKYYDIIDLKEIKDEDKVYINIEVYDKINNLSYIIISDKDSDNDIIFTFDNFYNILISEHNKYLIKIEYMKKITNKNLSKINVKPVVPQIYYNLYLPFYKWKNSYHFNYGENNF